METDRIKSHPKPFPPSSSTLVTSGAVVPLLAGASWHHKLIAIVPPVTCRLRFRKHQTKLFFDLLRSKSSNRTQTTGDRKTQVVIEFEYNLSTLNFSPSPRNYFAEAPIVSIVCLFAKRGSTKREKKKRRYVLLRLFCIVSSVSFPSS